MLIGSLLRSVRAVVPARRTPLGGAPWGREAVSVACQAVKAPSDVTTESTAGTGRRVRDVATYREMYAKSIVDPDGFWADLAKDFYWERKWKDAHVSYNFDVRRGPVHVEWFKGGKTNLTYNCLERNIERGLGDAVAFVWEGNERGESRTMTYREVLEEVGRVSNWLMSEGVQPGHSVLLYMPMVLELPICMLACARVGAVLTVVFAGFSAEALASRLLDCRSRVLLTATGTMHGTKKVELKRIADEAQRISAENGFAPERNLVLEVGGPSGVRAADVDMNPSRDVWYHDAVPAQPAASEPVWVDAEHPLILLYTSGSTGKPKGVQHSTGGYMVHAAATMKYVFDLQPRDVFWCTADCGWITGHTCVVYGALLNGATSLVFGGVPTYPDYGRCWEIIEKHKVEVFYTAPTAIRALMGHGDHYVTRHDRSSLRVLGTVGEPINPEAWRWYNEVVGEGRCPIVDTWWQTETGGVMLTPMADAWPLKPGSVTLPFFGCLPVVLDPDTGHEMEGVAEGVLAIKQAWPSAFRGLFGDQKRYESAYFNDFKGYYFTGDGVRRDEDGYLWITGRVDDVINVSGHRIGSAEVESALVTHPAVAEAAVVGFPHPVKGEGIYAYVTPMDGVDGDDALRKALVGVVRDQIGAFAKPDVVHFAVRLPKTRSGKIMRRILRKIANGQLDQMGDTSTLSDPSVVDALVAAAPPA